MSTVKELAEAIRQLTFEERCQLNAILHDWPDDDWDKQMKADAASRKAGSPKLPMQGPKLRREKSNRAREVRHHKIVS